MKNKMKSERRGRQRRGEEEKEEERRQGEMKRECVYSLMYL